jgi:site-specific recombinase XerD
MNFRVVHRSTGNPARSAYRIVEQTTGQEVDWINRYLDYECLRRVADLTLRGLSTATVQYYVPFTDQFLSERFRNKRLNLSMLCAADVTGFVQRHAHRLSPGRAKLLVTALRSFFRYLRYRGKISLDLAACVPIVPYWSRSTLPKFLPPGTVTASLESL